MQLSIIPKIAKAIRWKNPVKSRIVLFDADNKQLLDKIIFPGIEYTPVYCRQEEYPVSFQILFLMIKNFIHFSFSRSFKEGKFFGEIYRIYYRSLIEFIQPKIVITFIHDNSMFHYLSGEFTNIEFYAVQNGRWNRGKLVMLDENGNLMFSFSIPNFICFGMDEIEHVFSNKEHNIKNYFPMAPYIGDYYKSEISDWKNEIEFDLCLVSQIRDFETIRESRKDLYKCYTLIAEFIAKYLDNRKVSLCIARSPSADWYEDADLKYYTQLFGDRPKTTIINHDKINFSCYRAMERSEVMIALDSTASVEAFGWGKKVLFCNFTGDDSFSMPKQGVWTYIAENPVYSEFEKKLDTLLNLSDEEYRNISREASNYIVKRNPDLPTHKFIRNILMKASK